MKPNELVAVYGSLRQGLHNHKVIEDCEFVEEGVVKGFGMVRMGSYYPAISPKVKNTDIVVEVYNLRDENACRKLDILEGYPAFYDRKKVKVELSDGNEVSCWIYFINDDFEHHVKVDSGDWLKEIKVINNVKGG